MGEIKLIKDEPGDETDFHSPALVTAIAKIWWRYGSHKAEMHDSLARRRILTVRIPKNFKFIQVYYTSAFASTALFDGSMETLAIGGAQYPA